MDLRTYLFENRISQDKFAREIGCTRNYLSMIINRKKYPGKWFAKEIERITGGIVSVEELSRKDVIT